MSLDSNSRGILEKTIDIALEQVPNVVQTTRKAKESLLIKDESDYTFGFFHGYVLALFTTTFISTKRRAPNEDEFQEIGHTINRRNPEIREAISKAG